MPYFVGSHARHTCLLKEDCCVYPACGFKCSLDDGQLRPPSSWGDRGQSVNLYSPSSKPQSLYDRELVVRFTILRVSAVISRIGLAKSSVRCSSLLPTLQASSGKRGPRGRATCSSLWAFYRPGSLTGSPVNESERHTQVRLACRIPRCSPGSSLALHLRGGRSRDQTTGRLEISPCQQAAEFSSVALSLTFWHMCALPW